jgi:uncharacterized membrane protein
MPGFPGRLTETDRLEAFSDGVMAVIITIMAFSIRAPGGPSLSDLHGILPEVLVYILSFTMVGIYWNNHHHLLRTTERISASVMWANLFLLFWLSLFPLVTAWVGRFPRHALPAASFGFVGLGSGIAYTVLVVSIIRANGPDSLVARGIGSDLKGRLSLAFYAGGIGLAFVLPPLSYVLYIAVAVMWFLPDRRLSSTDDAGGTSGTAG